MTTASSPTSTGWKSREGTSRQSHLELRATADHLDSDAINFEAIDVSQHIDKLGAGREHARIQGLNVSASSSDFLIAVELSVSRSLAGDIPAAPATYTDPIHLTRSARLKARLRSGNSWSALAETTFAVGPVAESLRSVSSCTIPPIRIPSTSS